MVISMPGNGRGRRCCGRARNLISGNLFDGISIQGVAQGEPTEQSGAGQLHRLAVPIPITLLSDGARVRFDQEVALIDSRNGLLGVSSSSVQKVIYANLKV